MATLTAVREDHPNPRIVALHRAIVALGPDPDNAPPPAKTAAILALLAAASQPFPAPPGPYDVLVLVAAVVGAERGRFSALGEMASGLLLRTVRSSDACLHTFLRLDVARGLSYSFCMTASYAFEVLQLLYNMHSNPNTNVERVPHMLAVYDGGIRLVSELMTQKGNTARMFKPAAYTWNMAITLGTDPVYAARITPDS